jgi:hypothetical protein
MAAMTDKIRARIASPRLRMIVLLSGASGASQAMSYTVL